MAGKLFVVPQDHFWLFVPCFDIGEPRDPVFDMILVACFFGGKGQGGLVF